MRFLVCAIIVLLWSCPEGWTETKYYQFGFRQIACSPANTSQKFCQISDCVSDLKIKNVYIYVVEHPDVPCFLTIRDKNGDNLLFAEKVNISNFSSQDDIVRLAVARHDLKQGNQIVIKLEQTAKINQSLDVSVGVDVEVND